MPYIAPERRALARETFTDHGKIALPGDLAYLVAEALDSFVGQNYDFARLAAARGAVESALDEFQTNVVEPYERNKRAVNGDVFILARILRDPA